MSAEASERTRYVEVEPGLRVRCDEQGEGPQTLIVLNELADLAPLARNRRVVAITVGRAGPYADASTDTRPACRRPALVASLANAELFQKALAPADVTSDVIRPPFQTEVGHANHPHRQAQQEDVGSGDVLTCRSDLRRVAIDARLSSVLTSSSRVARS